MFLFFNPRLTQQKKRSSEFWPHLGVDLAWPQGNLPTFPPLSPGLVLGSTVLFKSITKVNKTTAYFSR